MLFEELYDRPELLPTCPKDGGPLGVGISFTLVGPHPTRPGWQTQGGPLFTTTSPVGVGPARTLKVYCGDCGWGFYEGRPRAIAMLAEVV